MKRILLPSLLLGIASQVAAQEKGYLTGSLESNNIYYVKDTKIDNSVNPDNKFGSNSYLKLDYNLGKFSAGIQMEGYLPALQGYDIGVYGTKKAFIGVKYASWEDEQFSFRAGDIFEQFGSGMIFRSFEDRNLGINNSIEGIRGSYNFSNYATIKGLYGRPRLYTDYADSWVRGADVSISLSDIVKWYDGFVNIEGSYVSRYEEIKEDMPANMDSNLNMYSGRLNFDYSGFNANIEYVSKGEDATMFGLKKGHGILAEIGYNKNGLSLLGTYRELKHMNTQITVLGNGVANVINYLPSLTRQYTYMLANLNPYIVETAGEKGGQFDAFYSYRDDRSKYWNFHANFSAFYSDKEITQESRLLWRDINFDIERQWNNSWKTTLLVSLQERNKMHGQVDDMYKSNIFVIDGQYKIDRKKSIRAEIQYLNSPEEQENEEKDWFAGLVEFNIAPQWSFSISDMYSINNECHYYSGSVSYTKKNTRVQLSYGRNRAGYVCSGGVCRYTPAYTGAGLTITSSF